VAGRRGRLQRGGLLHRRLYVLVRGSALRGPSQEGALVWVSGRLQLNRWQDAASGENRQAIRIVASNVDSPSFRANRSEHQAETLEQAALRSAAETTEAERGEQDDVLTAA